MRLLIDTHAALWLLAGDSRLSAKAREAFETADAVSYSVVSLWEIGIKLGLHRGDFQLQPNWWQVIPAALAAQGIQRLGVEPTHCAQLALLPPIHRDPFDRMLVAQAIAEEHGILSADSWIQRYDIEVIW